MRLDSKIFLTATVSPFTPWNTMSWNTISWNTQILWILFLTATVSPLCLFTPWNTAPVAPFPSTLQFKFKLKLNFSWSRLNRTIVCWDGGWNAEWNRSNFLLQMFSFKLSPSNVCEIAKTIFGFTLLCTTHSWRCPWGRTSCCWWWWWSTKRTPLFLLQVCLLVLSLLKLLRPSLTQPALCPWSSFVPSWNIFFQAGFASAVALSNSVPSSFIFYLTLLCKSPETEETHRNIKVTSQQSCLEDPHHTKPLHWLDVHCFPQRHCNSTYLLRQNILGSYLGLDLRILAWITLVIISETV